MAELGEMEEAAQRLPDLSTTQDVIDRTYHHLTMALIHKDPAKLEQASLSGFCAGKVAYYAVTLFDDPGYLPKALERDPESHWTRRASSQPG